MGRVKGTNIRITIGGKEIKGAGTWRINTGPWWKRARTRMRWAVKDVWRWLNGKHA
jgi:hypothetical protein